MNQPKKTVAATEMKNRFGDYAAEVVRRREPLLVERHGKPMVVIVNFDQWKKLREVKDEPAPWFDSFKELVDRIDRNHPEAKPFSAVDLVRQIRDEEER